MTLDLAIAIGGIFVAVALLVGLATSSVLSSQTAARRRLREVAVSRGGASVIADEMALTETPGRTVERLSKLVPKSPKEMGGIRRQLTRAGFYSPTAAVIFSLSEVAAAALLGFAAFTWFTGTQRVIFAVLGAVIGYLLPGLIVSRMAANHQKQIRNGLPDTLDLILICVEAGAGLDQSIVKAADELSLSYPALARELRMVNTEIRAGKPRTEAFRNFADRTGVDDVRAFVTMLVQTDRFGTSIAQALRTHADTLRVLRRQRAEERAQKLGVKLVFPLVFCLFPALFVVLLGPAAIKLYNVLFIEMAQ